MGQKDEAVYVAVDAWPDPDGPLFRNFVGAVVRCWIRTDTNAARSREEYEALVADKLRREGWTVAAVLSNGIAHAGTYGRDDERRQYYEQPLSDGFVAAIARRERSILGGGGEARWDADALIECARKIARHGGTTLTDGSQFANGVIDQEDEFVPFWPDLNDAQLWSRDWPGYSSHHLPAPLLVDAILPELASEGLWAALGVKQTLVTCHPLWIKNLARGEE